MSSSEYGKAEPYSPPEWAMDLKVVPKTRIPLCMLPSPVHQWRLPGIPEGFTVWVKRDDLTGSTLSGNKVRKLEFLLADALDKGCDCVLTCGSLDSNHTRATAIAARELGLDAILFVLMKTQVKPEDIGCRGNFLLNRLSGATVITVVFDEKLTIEQNIERLHQVMKEHEEKLRAEGRRPYFIPAGGFSTVGSWGYIHAWEELRAQGVLDSVDDVVVCGGSGGTASGLAVGNYLTGLKVKLHAVSIGQSAEGIYSGVSEELRELGMEGVEPRDIIDVTDEYIGEGYGVASKDIKDLIVSVFTATGIPLDTTFTAKAVQGMLSEMSKQPGRFRGKRVLFIHTGGVFNLFNGEMDAVIEATPTTSRIYSYQDMNTVEP